MAQQSQQTALPEGFELVPEEPQQQQQAALPEGFELVPDEAEQQPKSLLDQLTETGVDIGVAGASKLLNFARGVAREFGGDIPLLPHEQETIEQSKQRSPVASEVGELAGEVAPYLTGVGEEAAGLRLAGATGAPAWLGRILAQATKTGLVSGTQAVGEGGDFGTGFAQGALTDVGFAGAGAAIGKSAEAIGNQIKSIIKDPQAAEELVQLGQQHNVDFSTLDLSNPDTQLGGMIKSLVDKLPLTGIGEGKMLQKEAREALASDLGNKFGGDPRQVIDSLARRKNAVIEQAGQVKQGTVDRLGNIPLVKSPPTGREIGTAPFDVQSNTRTLRTIDRAIDSIQSVGGKRIQISPTEQKVVDTLNRYKQNLTDVNTFGALDDFRTRLRNELKPNFEEVGTRQQGAIKQIYGSMTRDLDDVVRRNSSIQEFDQWKQANHTFFEEAEKVKNKQIKDLLNANKTYEGAIGADQLTKGLLGKDVSRKQLYESLDDAGREHAKGVILNKFLQESGGSGQLSVNAFVGKLNRNRNQLKTWFRGDDGAELDGIIKVLNATKGAQGAGIVPKTGYQNTIFHMITGLASAFNPGAVVGGIVGTRLYNSPAVRDALIDIAKLPKGSPELRNRVNALMRQISNVTVAEEPKT